MPIIAISALKGKRLHVLSTETSVNCANNCNLCPEGTCLNILPTIAVFSLWVKLVPIVPVTAFFLLRASAYFAQYCLSGTVGKFSATCVSWCGPLAVGEWVGESLGTN